MSGKVIFTWNESDNQEMRDKFDNVIQPMINNQTSNDKVFLVSDEYDTRWASPNQRLGKYVNTYELAWPWFSGSEKDTKIVDSGDGLTLLKELNNGDVLSYDLYASPNESDELDLIRQCANFDNLKNNWWWGNEEDFEKFFNGEPIDGDVITDYFDSIVSAKGAIDYDKVKKYCNRIVNKLNESLNEERMQEDMKVVWSNNKTSDYLASFDLDSLKAELVDYGYDREMLDQLTDEELIAMLDAESVFWQVDSDEFDQSILPMINKQTCDGIVLMVGEAERFDGKHKGGRAVYTELLKGGDIDPDVTDVEIIEEDGGLVWLGHHHDGTHKFRLYALPETDQVDFIRNCMEDAIEDEYNWYHEGEDFDEVEDDILESVLANFTDLDYLTGYINFSQVPNYCKPIKNLLNESLNESKDDIVTIAVDAVLEDDIDLENIKEFDIKPEYSWNKAFDNLKLTGTKENIIKYLKSGLYNADDEWIKEYYPELLDEKLNEASTKNPKKLGKEIREIKKLAKDYGKEYFTSMPFTSYDNDPTSIEYNYPEFFRIVKLFFKEMGLADADQLNNNDWLDEMWDTDISQHDWDTIVRVCDRLVEKDGNGTIQIEKEYKTGYNAFLDDDQILADRERQAELAAEYDESLNEARYDLLDKKGYPIGSYTDRDRAIKAAKEKENELGSVVIHDKDSVKKYDKKYTGWLKQDESLNEKFEPNSIFHFDNSIDWDEFYDEDFIEKMKEHDGKPCHASVTVWVDGKEDPESNYFTITFEDGFELEDISGYHLDLDEVEIND